MVWVMHLPLWALLLFKIFELRLNSQAARQEVLSAASAFQQPTESRF